ncbi:MAG: nitroreductase family deazaflavin-dependent oxidoreductase [Dehalococcoidia bacterium]|nr:nitroreductase family deazaflavin-dependent oxidoreductase [Dehalococcoidia bacterium]
MPKQNWWYLTMQGLHAAVYRLSDGRVLGNFGPKAAVLVVTVTGRKSGRAITFPLVYFSDGSDIILVASNGGKPNHPNWYYNLLANPRVTVRIGAHALAGTARLLEGDEREAIWRKLVAKSPQYVKYQAGITREIPLFRVTAEGPREFPVDRARSSLG